MCVAVPGKCSGLTVSDITKNACRLRWKAPDDDGGSRLTHYVVERQEVGKPYWTTVASFAKVYSTPSRLSRHFTEESVVVPSVSTIAAENVREKMSKTLKNLENLKQNV